MCYNINNLLGVIHADFNEQNILVERADEDIKIKGIIDFRDSCIDCKVYDIAIYIMYMMVFSAEDPIRTAGYALRGYLVNCSLTQPELDVLYYCVAARIAQSLLIGLYNFSTRHDSYFLETQNGGWKGHADAVGKSHQLN